MSLQSTVSASSMSCSQKQSDSINPLVAECFTTKRSLLAKYLDEQRIDRFKKLLQQGLQANKPTIMFYGLYSAGKSTMICALKGANVAQVGRNPTTDCVTRYHWNGFDLDDTPGVDAPQEHEKVTQQQLEQSDLVLFVVSASAALDDRHTYDSILQLVTNKRKVLLVVNWRQGKPSYKDQIELNDGIRQQLQQQALAMGVSDIEALEQVPIHWLNAKMGLQGKVEQKPLLLRDSGLEEFEKVLKLFISETESFQIESRMAKDLVDLAKDAQDCLQERVDALREGGYQHLANRLQDEQSRIRGHMQQVVNRQHAGLVSTYKQLVQSVSDENTCEQQLSQLIEGLSQEAASQLEIQLEKSSQALEKLAVHLDKQQAELYAQVELPDVDRLPDIGEMVVSTGTKSNFLPKGAMQTIIQQIKSEHLVVAMKQAKSLLPSLFKGIGHKTMEKWADKIISVNRIGAPIVQVGIQVIVGIWQHYQQEKLIQQEQDAMVRFHEQVRAGAEQIANQYALSIESSIDQILLETLQPALRFIEDQQNGINERSAAFGRDNGQLNTLINQLQRHYKLDVN